MKDQNLIRIFVTYDVIQANMIRSLLEENGVNCFLKGENMFGSVFSGGIKVMILRDDLEKAKEIISTYTDIQLEQNPGMEKENPVNPPPFTPMRGFAVFVIILFVIVVFFESLTHFRNVISRLFTLFW